MRTANESASKLARHALTNYELIVISYTSRAWTRADTTCRIVCVSVFVCVFVCVLVPGLIYERVATLKRFISFA